MTDTSGTPILTAPVIAPPIEIVENPITPIENQGTVNATPAINQDPAPSGDILDAGVLKNATPIPESLKTALQQPQEKPTEKQSETIKPGNNNGGGFQAHPELINKEGRPKRKTITEYIIDELNKELPSGINGHQNMARLVLQMAFGRRDKNGKILARPDKELIKETWHYLDGMPTQKTQLTGDDDGPLQVEIIEHKEKKDES